MTPPASNDVLPPHLESRFNQVMEGILDNETLTSDLDDGGANALLNWARQRVKTFIKDTASLDDAAAQTMLAPRLKSLHSAMRRMSSLPSVWAGLSTGDRRATLLDLLQQVKIIDGAHFRIPSEGIINAFITHNVMPGRNHAVWIADLSALFGQAGER
jgi:hypothetical protein